MDTPKHLIVENVPMLSAGCVEFAALTGKTLTKVTRCRYDNERSAGEDAVLFETTENEQYLLTHIRDCCETVELDEIVGDFSDLLGSPLVQAEEVASISTEDSCRDSKTWTFYRLTTKRGQVVLRWGGTSNGYYSESVDLCKIKR